MMKLNKSEAVEGEEKITVKPESLLKTAAAAAVRCLVMLTNANSTYWSPLLNAGD